MTEPNSNTVICNAYLQGYNTGIEITKIKIIERTREYLEHALYDTRDNCGYAVVGSFDSTTKDEFIEDFIKNVIEPK